MKTNPKNHKVVDLGENLFESFLRLDGQNWTNMDPNIVRVALKSIQCFYILFS